MITVIEYFNRILHFVLEAIEAAGTVVGLLVHVFTAVGDEVGAQAECLPHILFHYSCLM